MLALRHEFCSYTGVNRLHKVKFAIFPNQSFVDLGLYQFGMESCEPGHTFEPARNKHYVFC